MITEKILLHNRGLESRKEGILSWKVPSSVKKSLNRFLEELELGQVNKGVKVGESRQTKYLDLLKIPLEYFNKETKSITLKDMESFEKGLSSGKIKSVLKNQPYAHSTQVDIRKSIKIFLRWDLGEVKALKLTDWLDTRYKEKTPDFLSEQELSKLYKACRTPEQRFLIAVLFDSGARAEEFHNIRYEDVHLPEGKDNFAKITLKEEYSKTKGRTISLYWKHSLEAIQEYLRERIEQGVKPKDPIFTLNYDAARRFLHRLGNSILNKSIHYHLFRHSSATYYATKINRQQLCYRYGWKFSSDMPDVYISRSGMENKEIDDRFTSTEIGALQEKVAKLEQLLKISLEEGTATIKQLSDKLKKS